MKRFQELKSLLGLRCDVSCGYACGGGALYAQPKAEKLTD